MNLEIYNKMAENEKEHWWFAARRNIIKSVVLKLNLKRDKILEIGSGTGGNIEFLQELGDLTLLECSSHAVDLTKKKYNIEPIHGCLPDIEFNEKFDLIMLLDVLEHIEEDELVLKKIKTMLNKNGKLVITVPAYQWLWSTHDEIHHHKKRYTLSELKKLTKDDYSMEYSSYMNFFLSPLIMLVRLLSGKGKDNDTEEILKIGKLNNIFKWIFNLESKFLPNFRFPFGISIIIVLEAKK